MIRINDDADAISQRFSNLLNAFTKAMNKKYNRTGSLLEKPFKRIIITDEIYLKMLIVYIHLNPEHHGISKDFTTYKYSSYQSFLSEQETNIQRKYVLELSDGLENFIEIHRDKKMTIKENISDLFLE